MLEQVRDYQVHELEYLFLSDVYKVLILDAGAEGDFITYARDHGLILKVHSYDKCFDLVLDGVSKYNGLAKYIDVDITDAFSFGNDFNDYELLANYPNSIALGSNSSLLNVAALILPYDADLQDNFTTVINTILG